MAETTKTTYTKADMLNYRQFAKKYGFKAENVYSMMLSLYRQNMHIKQLQQTLPVIIKSKTSHAPRNATNKKLPLLVHPVAHEYFLEKYFQAYPDEKQAPAPTKSVAEEMKAGTTRLTAAQIKRASAAAKAYMAAKKSMGK